MGRVIYVDAGSFRTARAVRQAWERGHTFARLHEEGIMDMPTAHAKGVSVVGRYADGMRVVDLHRA